MMERITMGLIKIIYAAPIEPGFDPGVEGGVVPPDSPRTFAEIMSLLAGILYDFVPLFYGLAFLLFFWGLAAYIYYAGAGNEAEMVKGKTLMIWGVIALFVLVSVWGLTRFIQSVFFAGGITPGLPAPFIE